MIYSERKRGGPEPLNPGAGAQPREGGVGGLERLLRFGGKMEDLLPGGLPRDPPPGGDGWRRGRDWTPVSFNSGTLNLKHVALQFKA